MAEEKKHTTLLDLLKSNSSISIAAVSNKHDGFLPTVAEVPKEVKDPTPKKNGTERGRILLFIPTNERVTVLRERVGQSYNGDWLHEVTTRDGHKFLANGKKQLKEVVK